MIKRMIAGLKSERDRGKTLLAIGVTLLILLYIGGIVGQFMQPDVSVGDNPWASATSTRSFSFSPFRALAVAISTSYGRNAVLIVAVVGGALYLLATMNGGITGGFFDEERNFTMSEKGIYGTASWMKRDQLEKVLDLKSIADTDGMILGQKYGSLVSLPIKSRLNRHVAVFGASGTGKSRCYARPAIIQAVRNKESYYITDPKGEMYNDTSQYARNAGYNVKVLNLVNPTQSDAWAALLEIKKSEDDESQMAQQFADAVVDNTTKGTGGQDYFVNAEKSLLKALVLYVLNDESRTSRQMSLGAAYDLVANMSLDQLINIFENLPDKHPAKAPWNIFTKNENTMGNTMSGLGVRLQILQSELIKDITGYDEIDLVAPAKEKSAYYLIMDDQSDTLDFLSSLFFTFTFIRTVNYADQYGKDGKTDVPVNFILDEFPNIGLIPAFEKKLATIRSRDLRVSIIFQNLSQLSSTYPLGVWENLLGNCDTQLFLGCTDMTTASYISERTGVITTETGSVNTRQSQTFMSSSPQVYGESHSTGSRVLLTPDEVLRLPNSEALVIMRGENVLKVDKFDFSNHPEAVKFVPSQIKDYVPSWQQDKKDAQNSLDLKKEAGTDAIKSMKSLNISDIAPTQEVKDIKAKQKISYMVGDSVTENSFLADINAVSLTETDIHSDFDEVVNMSKQGDYMVSLTSEASTVKLGVIVEVRKVVSSGPRKRMISINPNNF